MKHKIAYLQEKLNNRTPQEIETFKDSTKSYVKLNVLRLMEECGITLHDIKLAISELKDPEDPCENCRHLLGSNVIALEPKECEYCGEPDYVRWEL